MKNKTVLLLGGSGFIGKNIIDQLSNKYNIISPTHRELNLLDRENVDKYFSNNPAKYMIYAVNVGGKRNDNVTFGILENNLKMFFNVMRHEIKFKRIIFLGSGAEYDKRNNLKLVKEKEFDKSIPTDEYGFYKYVCSKMIETSNNIINLRLFGVYGKYEDYNVRFISNNICRSILNMPLNLNQNVRLDYIHVNDVIKIIDFFLSNNPRNKFYNVSTGNPITLKSIANIINEASEKKQKIIIRHKGLGKEYSGSNTLLLSELNFKFQAIDESIKELCEWYKTLRINKKSFYD